jgi:hypothetical protein
MTASALLPVACAPLLHHSMAERSLATGAIRTSQMGCKRRWPERTAIKLAAGTFKRIVAVLADGEDRMSFMRGAVERELKRRERKPAARKRR